MRRGKIILAILAGTSLVAGCGQTSASGSKTLTIAYWAFGPRGKSYAAWFNQVKPAFEKQHPGVTIVLEPIAAAENDFYTKLDLMMKSPSTAPDVVTEDTFLINADASAGLIQPLNSYVSSWKNWSQFEPAAKQAVTNKVGNIYGVPYDSDSRGLWYNVNLFKKAGLPVPWHPHNWNDIIAAATTLKAKDPGVIPFWSYVGKATGEATTMQDFEMLLYGTGNSLYDSSTNKWIVSSPGFLSSLQFIQNVYSHGLGPQLSQILNGQANNTETTQLMPEQKIGIALDVNVITANWLPQGPAPWPSATKTYDLTAMPTENGQSPGYTSMSGGFALSMSAHTKNKDLAWQFIQMATSEKNMRTIDIGLSGLPTRTDVIADPSYANAPGQVFKQATSFLQYTHYRPANAQYPEVSTAIQTAVESVATGSLSPQQAMAQYAQSVTRMVGASGVEHQ
ncbi:extracellular solute-binding protein [Alicyclobacillus curvatus]|nr:extracellular solute-binding protein [Alicyclobacillus curvatus]